MDFIEFQRRFQKVKVQEISKVGTEKPMVSVSVTTFQHKKYIKECLDGILMQKTHFPYEILLGDDDSTDGTREICLEYARKYPKKIRLFLHNRKNNIKLNGQATGRFNFLYNLFSARGKYIALCDGDDYWTDPTKLQKQITFLQKNSDVSVCFTENECLYRDGKKYKRNANNFSSFSSFKDLIKENFIVSSSVVLRNTFRMSGLPEFLTETYVGDWPLFLWCLQNNSKIYFLRTCSVVYRKNVGVSVIFKKQEKLVLLQKLKLQKEFYQDENFVSFKREIKESVNKTQIQLMAYYNKRKKYLNAVIYLWKGFQVTKPSHLISIYFYSIKLGMTKNYSANGF